MGMLWFFRKVFINMCFDYSLNNRFFKNFGIIDVC